MPPEKDLSYRLHLPHIRSIPAVASADSALLPLKKYFQDARSCQKAGICMVSDKR